MVPGPRRVVIASVVAAFVTFCVVQDRVTYYGTVNYAELVRAAAASYSQAAAVDEVMRPLVARSVRLGLLCGGLVLVGGLAFAALRRRR